MALRFNPPPSWPAPPPGWSPPPGWQPDAAWDPAPPGWKLWVDDRNWLQRNVALMVILILFLGVPALLGIVRELRSPSPATNQPSEADVAGAFGTAHISDHDHNVLAELGTYPRAWNAAAGPLMRDYQDPNVSAEDWVAQAGPSVELMRAAVRDFELQVLTIDNPDLRATLAPMSANYHRKFSAVVSLWTAVSEGDSEGETEAIVELQAASQEAEEFGGSLMDRLRPLVTPEDFDRLLEMSRAKAGG